MVRDRVRVRDEDAVCLGVRHVGVVGTQIVHALAEDDGRV